MTREEEIKQAIKNYDCTADEALAFIAGAIWADEHPQNPWKKPSEETPKYDEEVIGFFKSGDVCKCKCSPEERIWFIDMIVCDEPDFWMHIPNSPKGGAQ